MTRFCRHVARLLPGLVLFYSVTASAQPARIIVEQTQDPGLASRLAAELRVGSGSVRVVVRGSKASLDGLSAQSVDVIVSITPSRVTVLEPGQEPTLLTTRDPVAIAEIIRARIISRRREHRRAPEPGASGQPNRISEPVQKTSASSRAANVPSKLHRKPTPAGGFGLRWDQYSDQFATAVAAQVGIQTRYLHLEAYGYLPVTAGFRHVGQGQMVTTKRSAVGLAIAMQRRKAPLEVLIGPTASLIYASATAEMVATETRLGRDAGWIPAVGGFLEARSQLRPGVGVSLRLGVDRLLGDVRVRSAGVLIDAPKSWSLFANVGVYLTR